MGAIDTAANIAFCNESLSMLGAETVEVDGTSQNHTYCETFFTNSLYEILSAHKWNFAKKRAYAIQTTDPLFGYDNAFTVPSDCVRIWMVDEDPLTNFQVEGGLILTDAGDAPDDYDEDGVDYLAGQYISSDISGSDLTYLVDTAFTSSDETTDIATYCTSQGDDYEVLAVEYVYQHTTLTTWPIYARQCGILNLAIKLCSPIKQGEKSMLGFQAMLYGSKNVRGVLGIAKSYDAQEGGGESITTSKWIDARTA